jgi:hypothetical protein
LITAHLDLAGAGNGSLDLRWNDRETDAVVEVTGVVDGQEVRAERRAP